MKKFNAVTGLIAPMLSANIDTDVIMPKQFLMGIDRKGLDKGVFFDQRFLTSGEPNPEFILNQPKYHKAKFLLVGENFGCGSSREHAVWGLKQLGIEAIIGTTFAGIFYDNCQRNGLLLIQISPEHITNMSNYINSTQQSEICINLPEQTITLNDNNHIQFDIDALRKDSLIKGLDAIGSTLVLQESIQQFEQEHHRINPWLA